MSLDAAAANPTYQGEVDRAVIEEQLERLLLNRHFSQSRRFPAFLRFVRRPPDASIATTLIYEWATIVM